MTYLTDLTTTRDNIAALLKDLTANPKPSYWIDGQRVLWGEYLKTLTDQLSVLNTQVNATDPVEVHTVGYT